MRGRRRRRRWIRWVTARAAHYPKQLSGGEQRRVAIARAFVAHTAVVFATNPPAIWTRRPASASPTFCSN